MGITDKNTKACCLVNEDESVIYYFEGISDEKTCIVKGVFPKDQENELDKGVVHYKEITVGAERKESCQKLIEIILLKDYKSLSINEIASSNRICLKLGKMRAFIDDSLEIIKGECKNFDVKKASYTVH